MNDAYITNWDQGAAAIAAKIHEHDPTHGILTTIHGTSTGQSLQIIHSATIGDLLVCFFLAILTGTILLQWAFKAIWGR